MPARAQIRGSLVRSMLRLFLLLSVTPVQTLARRRVASCGADTPAPFGHSYLLGLPDAECPTLINPLVAEPYGDTTQNMCSSTVAQWVAAVGQLGITWNPPTQDASGVAVDNATSISQICPDTCGGYGVGPCAVDSEAQPPRSWCGTDHPNAFPFAVELASVTNITNGDCPSLINSRVAALSAYSSETTPLDQCSATIDRWVTELAAKNITWVPPSVDGATTIAHLCPSMCAVHGHEGSCACGMDLPGAMSFATSLGLADDECSSSINHQSAAAGGSTPALQCSGTVQGWVDLIASLGITWSPPTHDASGVVVNGTTTIAQLCESTCASYGVIVGSCTSPPPVDPRLVLIKLYESTGGAGWTNRDGWLGDGTTCSWHGVGCSGTGEVSSIWLDSNSLTGEVPTQVGMLTTLDWLIFHTNSISGGVPTQLGLLTALKRLNLRTNSFFGEVPTQLGRLTNLIELTLERNSISGVLPTQLGLLSALKSISVRSNSLSGVLPTELGLFPLIKEMLLDENSLSGKVPTQFGRLSTLEILNLPVRWFHAPVFSCMASEFIPRGLIDHTFESIYLSQPLVYKVPLLRCDTLVSTWASVAVVAALPLLLLIVWAVYVSLYHRGSVTLVTCTSADLSSSTQALENAMEAGRLLSLKVSGLLFVVGWALFCFGMTPLIFLLLRRKPDDAGVIIPLLPLGLLAMLLSVPPTAAHVLIGSLCAGFFTVQTVLAVCCLVEIVNMRTIATQGAFWGISAYGLYWPIFIIASLSAIAILPACVSGRCCSRAVTVPRLKLLRLWLLTRFVLLGLGLVFIVTPLTFRHLNADGSSFLDSKFGADLASWSSPAKSIRSFLPVGITFVILSLISTPVNRGRVRRSLGQLGSPGNELGKAAAVAALTGGNLIISKVLALAATRFRTISLDVVHKDDFLNNRGVIHGHSMDLPSTNVLYSKTQSSVMGSCDAFISHSWSDDGNAKYYKLCAWQTTFRVHNRRVPTIWLDKACIDQSDIAADLLCLPLFISGCKELLVLAGTTYHTRLWCVMELFTFVQMGGAHNRITVMELGTGVREALAKFDASKAQCFLQKDRQHLLAVMETGFGDLQPFNKVIRALLKERTITTQPVASCHCVSATSSSASKETVETV